MLLFAHTGITLGIGWLIKEKAAARLSAVRSETTVLSSDRAVSEANLQNGNSLARHSFTAQVAGMDLRILIIGSLLPDIIDKPLGQIILRHSLNNGRIYSHTLLFLVALTLIGMLLYRSRRWLWMYLLASGTLIHFLLDEMWRTPGTLLWPLLGWGFPWREATLPEWIWQMFLELFSSPAIFIPELIGFIILVAFTIMLFKRHEVGLFLRYGLLRN